MKFNKKHFPLLICFLNIFYISFAQEFKAINNKGTIINVRNNTVITSNTAPTNALEGDVWIDNTIPENLVTYIKDTTKWNIIESHESKTVILNSSTQKSLIAASNTFYTLPLTTSNVQTINSNYFEVSNSGPGSSIKILKDGNYLISGEISVTNMPSGGTKFILGVMLNSDSARIGYLSRGFASLPSKDYWGTTGTLMYKLKAGSVIKIRYVLNGSGTINSDFLNIGITKI
ncbi:hypothetical protein [Lutibacter citreus]|uniref:hypothetical protein n=1 Tax=Lutibacter citreus TaxID=2138210 RepID=UPI000DBE4271|nr:hypothetical protein [Lutibacter citreus]